MAGSGSDDVTFVNKYSATVSIAYMRREESCRPASEGGIPFVIRGWRNVPPNGKTVIANPTENRWFYIFAQATDGKMWSGDLVFTVLLPAFSRCAGLGVTGGQSVGFVKLDTSEHDVWNLVAG